VVVSLLPDFASCDIARLLSHSDSKMLFIGPSVWKNVGRESFRFHGVIVNMADFTILQVNDVSEKAYPHQPSSTVLAICQDLHKEDFILPENGADKLSLINYTSGSTGDPKGVMLSAHSICSNIETGMAVLPAPKRGKVVSILPLSHMFGQVCEFLYPLCSGCQIYFLTQTPTPSVLLQALQEIKPYLLVMVPLVMEKIYQKKIRVRLSGALVKKLWNIPFIRHSIRRKVRGSLHAAFGGNIQYLIFGGAALNPLVEDCLRDIHYPFSVGYGMTECGPLIAGSPVAEFRNRSCGRRVLNTDIRISEPNEQGVGEIQVKGINVMLGYYKNEKATSLAFTADGWFRTGDLGYLDSDGYIYLRGRIKTMFLNASGQNIYPEDIELKLNLMEGVEESLVVEREGKLVALVFPEENIRSFSADDVVRFMHENLQKLNKIIPHYAQVSDVEIKQQPFEKTPKKSIKRFLYR